MNLDLLEKVIPPVGTFITLFRAPADIAYSTVNYNVVNLSDQVASVRVAIVDRDTPSKYDYVDYDIKLDKTGDFIEKHSLILSPLENLIVYTDTNLVCFRVTGINTSILSPFILNTDNMYSNFGIWESTLIIPISFQNLIGQSPIIKIANNSNFNNETDANIRTITGVDGVTKVYVVLPSEGTFYIRATNDNKLYSNILVIPVVKPNNYIPVVSNGTSVSTLPTQVNLAIDTEVNYRVTVTNQEYEYLSLNSKKPITKVYISDSATFDTIYQTQLSNYDLNNPDNYYIKISSGQTYYVKAVTTVNNTDYVSAIYQLIS